MNDHMMAHLLESKHLSLGWTIARGSINDNAIKFDDAGVAVGIVFVLVLASEGQKILLRVPSDGERGRVRGNFRHFLTCFHVS